MSKGRLKPPVNWTQQMKNFIESYPLDSVQGINDETALAHAIQKDAIQNSLDAMVDPDDFSITFEIDDLVNPSYIMITDRGTTGLTGKPSLTRSQLERLSQDQYRKERWSRFQALGYTHPDIDSDMRGARGQGKFIFIGGSKTREMIFDTLRDDGVYRVGHWETDRNDPLMSPLEDTKGEEYLQENTGLEPLDHVGTRIIIPNPKPELSVSFRGMYGGTSDMKRYISSTWWHALENGIDVKMKTRGDEEVEIEPPELYRRFRSDPDSFTHWKLESTGKPFESEKIAGCMVRELVLARSEESIPPLLRGISIGRGGMTVERLDPIYGNPHLPTDENEHIFGWLTLNNEAERKLRNAEVSSHYHFDLRVGKIPKLLFGRKGWINEQIERFCEKELGYGTSGRDLTRAESKVLNKLNRLARNAGYDRPANVGGSRKTEAKDVGERKRGELRAQVGLDYPTEGSTRVEFGEKIRDVKARVANYYDSARKCQFRFSINKKDGYRREDEKVRLVIAEEEIEISSDSKTDWYTLSSLTFDEDTYSEGTYVVHALIKNPKTGGKIHEKRNMIYLNKNPPLKWGIFKEVKSEKFKHPNNKLMYRTVTDVDKKLTLILNELHPLYQIYTRGRNKPDENYVLLCGVNAMLDWDLQKAGKIVGGKKHIKNLMETNERFGEVAENISFVKQEFLNDVFR